MKLKSFIQFLNEMPLPIDSDPKDFDPKPGKYSSASVIKKFDEIGFKIGKGSSRVAFKVLVEASQFNPNILKQYGLSSSSKVETVFKLALNPKGIAQNRAEIDNFKTAASFGHEIYLLPILDTSTRNKKYTFADEELSNWIQFPVAYPPTQGRFKALFDGMYGQGMLEKFKYTRNLVVLRKIQNGSPGQPANKTIVQTPEQHEAFEDFLTAMEDLQLGIVDLGRPANWGVWNNKLYILDYGFDDSTMDFYHGSKVASAWVDKSGNITFKETAVKRNNNWNNW